MKLRAVDGKMRMTDVATALNKKVATWCNEYVLRNADEVWVGDISPNGMLSSMLSRHLQAFAADLPASAADLCRAGGA